MADLDSANVSYGVIFARSTRSRRSRHVRFASIASEIRHRSETTLPGECRFTVPLAQSSLEISYLQFPALSQAHILARLDLIRGDEGRVRPSG